MWILLIIVPWQRFLFFQVVSRGGFYVGNGINWKGQVFSKMRNHTVTNRMTVRIHYSLRLDRIIEFCYIL